ncbi:hypothetical protein TrCOL_g5357 [Triparma columacea]|uniref:Uncharacterized protein n=1 Tax=Triparma columacea TaxID=722753 RepID=A0A9W7LE97_9STRA|nr:hypothetical protein TrCOL_g5357 [Triparma columacea]
MLHKDTKVEDFMKSTRCTSKNHADAYKNAAVIVPVLQETKAKDVGFNIEDGTPIDPSAIHPPLHRKPVVRGPKRQKPYPNRGLETATKSITASTTIEYVEEQRPRRAGAGTNRHREGGR